MRVPGIPAIARAAGFAVAAAAIAAALIYIGRAPINPIDRPGVASVVPTDPMARELARCRAMGRAARDDAACGAALAEDRRRFFTYAPYAAANPVAR